MNCHPFSSKTGILGVTRSKFGGAVDARLRNGNSQGECQSERAEEVNVHKSIRLQRNL